MAAQRGHISFCQPLNRKKYVSALDDFQKPTTVETAQKLKLLPEEFAKICQVLGRAPNFTELSVYSVMWSEHCSYKNSIIWLKKLPKMGSRVLAAAGEENAGLMDIGDGLGVCFKIESHNHPSAIEPYQGAATGVGGIHRDIFTMGARPIASLNSLRFGQPDRAKTRHLLRGVVDGIGHYGNAFGVPTVGGELFFDACYNTNPLVNAMSVGIVKRGGTASATASGVGNSVFIVGSATGKDGIHGATFASEDITEKSSEQLPSVQVGDPFTEKLLLEATLEAIATGAVVGIQDMGAAGVACSTSEMSARGNVGMDLQLDQVPPRQQGMQPFEVLLSESQERMLLVVQQGREAEILRVFDKWDLNCKKIGVVTAGGVLRYYWHGALVGQIPAESLVLGGGAPVYTRDMKEPAYRKQVAAFKIADVPIEKDFKKVLAFLLQHPNICSRRWVRRQYDSMVGVQTATGNKLSDAAVVHVHGTRKGIAMTTDCNPRYVYSDPEKGCAHAVAEAARNIACSGGIPLGVTNCLNFGNPYNPEVYWQFANSILGMKAACEAFDTPVTGGNVSFYNQSSDDGPVFPTPTIGMVGLVEEMQAGVMTVPFKQAGDKIYLLGNVVEDLACSEYAYSYHRIAHSPAPHLDLNAEKQLQAALLELIKVKLIASAHDVSDGGLLVTLAESAFDNKLGFEVNSSTNTRPDAFWFGEAGGRAVVSLKAGNAAAFEEKVRALGIACLYLGSVTDGAWVADGQPLGDCQQNLVLYSEALEKMLLEQPALVA